MELVLREKDPVQAAEWAGAGKLQMKGIPIPGIKDVEWVEEQASGMKKTKLKNNINSLTVT